MGCDAQLPRPLNARAGKAADGAPGSCKIDQMCGNGRGFASFFPSKPLILLDSASFHRQSVVIGPLLPSFVSTRRVARRRGGWRRAAAVRGGDGRRRRRGQTVFSPIGKGCRDLPLMPFLDRRGRSRGLAMTEKNNTVIAKSGSDMAIQGRSAAKRPPWKRGFSGHLRRDRLGASCESDATSTNRP